jgi:probable HAF family extracellular repeat protein
MRRFLWSSLGALVLAGVVVASSGGATQAEARWVMTDLGTLGGAWSIAYAINEQGHVAGASETRVKGKDGYPTWHAFLWEEGGMRDLGLLPGMKQSYPSDLNERGQIVGSSGAEGWNGRGRAFLWENGRMNDLGVLPGDRWSTAVALNDAGQVIGYSWSKARFPDSNWEEVQAHAFLWMDGRRRALGTLPGDAFSRPIAINESGQVIGVSFRKRTLGRAAMHAFLWENGTMRRLGTLGGRHSEPTAINDRGQVVGRSNPDPNTAPTEKRGWRAFLWEAGKIRDLGVLPGGTFSWAVDVNDQGQVVGEGETRSGSQGVFLWRSGKVRELRVGGNIENYVTAIDNRGRILGFSLAYDRDVGPVYRDFVWDKGKATPLEPDFKDGNRAAAMNDRGQAAGSAWLSAKKQQRAVLWTFKR